MSKPIPLLLIQRGREIISDEQHWCRGSYARGRAGASVSVHDADARRFCAMGALLLAASEFCKHETDASNLAHETAKLLSPTGSLVFINDYSGHAAVLSLFDQAITSFAD
jgi:hypothetical protein